MARRASGSLTALSTEALQRELSRRSRSLPALERKRGTLLRKLASIEDQIAALGGMQMPRGGRGGRGGRAPSVVVGGTRRRAKNDMNLVEALEKLLKGKTMSVTEAAGAVQDAGYKTTAANFRTIVNQALIKHKVFKKVARGQYTVS